MTSSPTSLSGWVALSGVHGSLPCRTPVERADVSIEACEPPAVHLRDVEVRVSFPGILELHALLVVHVDEILVGLVPRVEFVSLVHHEAFDVLHSSHASWRQKTALGRCWIDIEL